MAVTSNDEGAVEQLEHKLPPAPLTADVEQLPPTATAGTPTHHHTLYMFKRLRRPMAAPTQFQNHLIFIGLCLSMILCGWTDGSVGPLIPSLQIHYNINYLKMSLIYTTGFAGGMASGLLNVWITDRIGFGLATPLGALSSAIGYIFMATGANYGLWLVAFFFNGFGLGIQDAGVNNITSRLANGGTKMMIVQACFGLGGTIAPLPATAFAEHVAAKSYLYFWVAAGVAVITLIAMLVCFGLRTEEQIDGKNVLGAEHAETAAGAVSEKGDIETRDAASSDSATPSAAADAPAAKKSSGATMKLIFSTPAVYALLAFSFLYIGVEVCISSWAVTFLRHERGGGASAGYVSTGFWGGVTLGRIILIPVTNRLGYQLSIYVYSIISIAFLVIIWTTDSLIGNAVCYVLNGIFTGPVYPIGLMVVAEVLDDSVRGGVMGLMGALGGAGAAAVPFIAGAISDKYGIWTIQPVAVSMIAAYTLIWATVPTKKKVAAVAADDAVVVTAAA